MRRASALLLAGLVVGSLMGCAAATEGTKPLAALLVSNAEAAAHGGWTVAPDDGPVDGDTSDCTGKPADWPNAAVIAHASQFLDAPDGADSIAVVVKQFDRGAAANVQAVRDALAPCAPASGETTHGAMIDAVGDDSFAYQSKGMDETGDYILYDTVVACGTFEIEAVWMSRSLTLDQGSLETLLSGPIKRMMEVGNCG